MTVKFNFPINQLRNTLPLIPAIYKKDFEKLNTIGYAVLNGFVKRTYGPTQFPAYDVNLEVKDGSFKYPDLPKPVKNVQLVLHATNPDGLPDNAVLDISKGHLEMDKEPFDFKLLLKNPETARYIDAAAKGKLDLSQVSQFIKLPHDTKMSGLVWADAWAKGNMSAMEKLQGPFNAGGFFNIRDLFYSSKDFPEPIRNGNMNVSLENSGGIADKTMIHVTSAHMEVGNDPVDFSLQLSNPVSTVNFNGSAKGRFTLDNAKQFTKFDPGTSVSGVLNADVQFAGNKKIINDGEYDKMNILGSASLNNVKYVTRDYPTGIVVNNVSADFAPSNVNIREFSGHYLGSGFSGNGSLNNLISFIVKNAPLSGMVNASLDKMNLNEWIGKTTTSESTTSSSANARPFLVPVNMNVSVNAKAGQVSYDKVDYDNINGNLLISNETVKLDNIRANALDGTIMLNGSYSTRLNKVKPDISLNYDIEDMDVQKVFYAFNPIQFIMPIGKFLSGKLSSALSMTGNLKGDMMPDLKSLTGKGNLLLLKGVLKQFAPLEKLAMVLQIDRLKSITLQDIKNYFEFANGRVLIKPFTIKIDSIEMLISGFHGFDQSIDYAIQMKLPRRVMGTKGNDLITGLAASANSSGIPLKLGEMINLDIKMSGTLTNPYIGINLKGMVDDVVKDMAQQAKDFLQAKMDSLKQKAKDSLAATLKNQLEDNLKNKLKNQFFGKDTSLPNNNPTDTSQQKEPIINNLLKNLLNRNKKPKDSTHNQ